jgi:hypothetical protein
MSVALLAAVILTLIVKPQPRTETSTATRTLTTPLQGK